MVEEDFRYVPLGRVPEETPEAPRPLSPSTRSSWVISLTPLGLFAFDIWIAALLGGYITWQIVFAVGVVGIVLTYVCALDDQRHLARRGFQTRTSPVLALVSPTAYLFVRGSRAFRESFEGFGPAWIQVASVIVMVIAVTFMLPLMVKMNEIQI
jgi:hypothetical protein